MKIKEIREKSPVELQKLLKDLQKELFHLRFQLAINQLENPARINTVKKDIARIKTILREDELKNSVNA